MNLVSQNKAKKWINKKSEIRQALETVVAYKKQKKLGTLKKLKSLRDLF